MEHITGDYKTLIEKCVAFAAQLICIPPTELLFDDCPSNRFPTVSNAAESSVCPVEGKDGYYLHGRIIFNKPWFEKSWTGHKLDLEFYIFHELRHLHQQLSMEIKRQHQPTNEPYEEISKWENEFNNYKCNDGSAEAREENMAQEVELDANGYGLSLLMLYHIKDTDFTFEYSLPEEAYKLADARSRMYYKTKSEEIMGSDPIKNS